MGLKSTLAALVLTVAPLGHLSMAHPPAVWVVGDSISVASKPQFEARGWAVDAVVGRQFYTGIRVWANDEKAAIRVLVVELGTNGPVSQQDVKNLMWFTGNQRRVVFVNNYIGTGPYSTRLSQQWVSTNNRVFAWARATWPHTVRVVNWYGLCMAHTGYLSADAVHPSWRGRVALALAIARAIP